MIEGARYLQRWTHRWLTVHPGSDLPQMPFRAGQWSGAKAHRAVVASGTVPEKGRCEQSPALEASQSV